VEALAVVGDQPARVLEDLGEAAEDRRLLAEAPQEPLLHLELAVAEAGDADEEGHRARAPREARGLGVEEDAPGRSDRRERGIEREARERLRIELEQRAVRDAAVLRVERALRRDPVERAVLGGEQLARQLHRRRRGPTRLARRLGSQRGAEGIPAVVLGPCLL